MHDPRDFVLKWLDWICASMTVTMGIACIVSVMFLHGCGLLASEPARTVLDVARGSAIDVLTKVIADRFGSDMDKASAYCEELPVGFQSGIEELDDEERGGFVLCWAKAGE